MNIKRYEVEKLNCCFDADMIESPNGEYVEYADYARLKAEVERLRKAGDNLARASDENGCHDNGDADDLNDAIKRWNAAKEGKPSV